MAIARTNFAGSIGQLAGIASQEALAELQMALQREVEERRARQHAEQLARQDRELALREQNSSRDDARAQAYLDLATQNDADASFERDRNFKLREKEVDYRTTQPAREKVYTEARAAQALFDAEWELANEGIGQDNPKLTPEQNATLKTRRESVRKELTAGQAWLQGMADNMNRLGQLDQYIKLSNDAKKTAPKESVGFVDRALDMAIKAVPWLKYYPNAASLPRWVGAVDVPAAANQQTREDIDRDLADWNREKLSLAPIVQNFMNVRGGQTGLIQDPSGRWRPVNRLAFTETSTGEPAAPAEKTQQQILEEATAGSPLRLPAKQDQLQTGVWYQTRRGPALWDGTQFVQE